MRNWRQTIISQYSTAPTLVQLIANLNSDIDPGRLVTSMFLQLWNVDTAVGYGLDVWGRIVGVGRVLQIAQSKYFGFEEATNLSADPFNQSPYYGGQQLNTNYVLSDDGFRTLILAKAFANICDGSVKAVNNLLMILFAGRGDVYVQDNNDMTMVYTFTFVPTPVETSIVVQSGVLPRPSGVDATMAII